MKAKAWCMIPHGKKDGIEIEMKPLVLCEDCRWYESGENDVDAWKWCRAHRKDVYPKFFCADGEKRGEDE